MNNFTQILKSVEEGNDFYILLGDFLDEFYRSDRDKQQSMIFDEPAINDCPRELLSFVAASAHKLANDYQLEVPKWVFKKRYYTNEPFFAGNVKGKLRLLFMYKSPTEFKHRNLFVDENVLKRV